MVSRHAHNVEIVGSNPAAGTMFILFPLLMINNDCFQLNYAIVLSRSYNFESSQKVLKKIDLKQIKNKETYYYYRMVNGFYLNNKKEVIINADKLENDFFVIPERYKAMVNILRGEVKYWKKDDIGDIARDMRQVQNKLKWGNVGRKTQKTQKDIVDRLTKLIDKLENKNQDFNKDEENLPKNEKQSQQNPLQDSKIINNSGKGLVNHVKIKNLRERWGQLPPKERSKALQEIIRGMPERYRLSIENYFRNLSKKN